MTLPIVTFRHTKDIVPVPAAIDLADLERHEVRAMKEGPAWSPVSYKPGTTRAKANVALVNALVLDVDHADLPRESLAGLYWVAHTTHSHNPPDDPRWRVVIPLARPIEGADWPAYWLRARERFGAAMDPACKDSSRFYYWPSARPGAAYSTERGAGDALDPDTLPDISPQEPTPRPVVKRREWRGDISRYAKRALSAEVLEVAGTDSGRNNQLNDSAFALGQLIGGGELPRSLVEQELLSAAEQCGLVNDDGINSVEATLASGLNAGELYPRNVPAMEWSEPLSVAGGRVRDSGDGPIWAKSSDRVAYTIRSAAQIQRMEFQPLKFAIPGLIPEGVTVLAGRPKIGKSWTALGLAIAIAVGGCALGSIHCDAGDVLCLALEDSPRRLQDRMRLLGAPDGLCRLDLVSIPDKGHKPFPTADKGGLQELELWIQAHPETRLVIIDTLARFRPGRTKGGDIYLEDYAAMSAIKQLADAYQIGILVVHHLTKAFGKDGDFVESVSGSTGITGAADGIIVMDRERHANAGLLKVTGRDIEEREFSIIEQSIGKWVIAESGLLLPTKAESPIRRQIIDVLRLSAAPMSAHEIAMALDIDANTAKQRLWQMGNGGILLHLAGGRYTLPSYREEAAQPVEQLELCRSL